MTDASFPWLVFPPAVDLANTVLIITSGDRDLLQSDDQLEAWIAAERGRIPGVTPAWPGGSGRERLGPKPTSSARALVDHDDDAVVADGT